jgi:hypothetical protein
MHIVCSSILETLNCQYNHSCYNRYIDHVSLGKINTHSENNIA